MYFPVNFVEFLRAPFIQSTFGGCFWQQVLMNIQDNASTAFSINLFTNLHFFTIFNTFSKYIFAFRLQGRLCVILNFF